MVRHHRSHPRRVRGKRHRVIHIVGRGRSGERPAIAAIGDGPAGNRVGDGRREHPPFREEVGKGIIGGAETVPVKQIALIADLETQQPGSQRIGGIGRLGCAIRGIVHRHVNAVDDLPVGGQRLDETGKRIHLRRRDGRQARQAAPASRVHTIGANAEDGGTNLSEHIDHRSVVGDKQTFGQHRFFVAETAERRIDYQTGIGGGETDRPRGIDDEPRAVSGTEVSRIRRDRVRHKVNTRVRRRFAAGAINGRRNAHKIGGPRSGRTNVGYRRTLRRTVVGERRRPITDAAG